MTLAGCMASMVDAQRPMEVGPPIPLEVVTYEDADRVGALGTGCTWRGGPDRTGRMAMADDRAAVKRNGRVVALKPAADAKALFFTYDRWTVDGMRIVIRDTRKVVRRGYEFSETVAWLDLVEDGRTRSWRGRLNCGS